MERLLHLRHQWPLVAICAFYIYLAFHALSGSQGLMRWVDYEQDIVRHQASLEDIRAERAKLEAHADSLKTEHLDLDMLDIKARQYLFVSRPEELTIWLDPDSR